MKQTVPMAAASPGGIGGVGWSRIKSLIPLLVMKPTLWHCCSAASSEVKMRLAQLCMFLHLTSIAAPRNRY